MPNNPNDRNQGGQGRGQKGQTGGSQRTGNEDFGSRDPQHSGQNTNSSNQQSGSKAQQTSGRGGDINLRLTPEQQAQIRQATGKNLQSLSLSVEDLGQGETQGSQGASSRGESASYGSSRSEEDATGSDETDRMEEEV